MFNLESDDVRKVVSAAVVACMKSQNIDEAKLAEKLGTTVPYAYKLKKGLFGLEKAGELSAVFGLKLSEFITIGERVIENES